MQTKYVTSNYKSTLIGSEAPLADAFVILGLPSPEKPDSSQSTMMNIYPPTAAKMIHELNLVNSNNL